MTKPSLGVKEELSISTILVVSPDQVSSDLGGEVVILNLASGTYYGLNDVGARIWRLLQEPRSVKDVLDELVRLYDVEPDRCEKDLLDLLCELASEGLIEKQDGTPA